MSFMKSLIICNFLISLVRQLRSIYSSQHFVLEHLQCLSVRNLGTRSEILHTYKTTGKSSVRPVYFIYWQRRREDRRF